MANICTNLFFCSTENKENLKTVENYMTDTVFRSIFSVFKSSTCCLRSRSADSFLWAKGTGLRVKCQGLKPFRVRLKKSPHFHFVPSRIFSGSLDIYPPATLNSPRNEIGTLRALDAKKMSALWNKKD